jgi:hypothetical protein
MIGNAQCGRMPGRTQNGRWYEVRCPRPLAGTFIKLLTTRNEYLSITGIEVFAGGRGQVTSSAGSFRVSFSGATQSSPYANNRFPASNAINGSGKFTHTNKGVGMWWSVRFRGTYNINRIRIRNRRDCCGGRLAGTRVLVDGKECGRMPGRTQNGRWYEVSCSLRGSSVKLVTTRNTYLSIAGFQAYAGGRAPRLGFGSSRLIKLTHAYQTSPYGNNRFPAANAINGSGKFTHTNRGVGQYWSALFNGRSEGQISFRKVANRRFCTGYKPSNMSFRRVQDCLNWVTKTDPTATHFFFRHEGNYHCAICPKSYTGGNKGTGAQNSRIYTYEIVNGSGNSALEKKYGGDRQGACRRSDGSAHKKDFRITKARGGNFLDCLRQCEANPRCTAVGTYFPSGNWKRARDCSLQLVGGYGPSGLPKHRLENCFVKGGNKQGANLKPVKVAFNRFCQSYRHNNMGCRSVECC